MDYVNLDEATEIEPTPVVWTAQPVLDIVLNAPENSFVIDTGCHKGAWIRTMGIHHFLDHSIKTIGIDILNHNCGDLYDFFFATPLDVEEKEREAFIFHETAINSLHNRNPNLSYDDAPYMALNTTKTMTTKRLDTVLETLCAVEKAVIDKIHYLKVDCQGNDVNVVKSLGKYLDKTDYVQIETTFDDQNLYDISLTYVDDIKEMRELGFTPIYYCSQQKRAFSMPKEGEILFKRQGIA
tara:strand:- start:1731 stop:2447 length:717 start_codon:yes stop_codon:yes gene_type:complete